MRAEPEGDRGSASSSGEQARPVQMNDWIVAVVADERVGSCEVAERSRLAGSGGARSACDAQCMMHACLARTSQLQPREENSQLLRPQAGVVTCPWPQPTQRRWLLRWPRRRRWAGNSTCLAPPWQSPPQSRWTQTCSLHVRRQAGRGGVGRCACWGPQGELTHGLRARLQPSTRAIASSSDTAVPSPTTLARPPEAPPAPVSMTSSCMPAADSLLAMSRTSSFSSSCTTHRTPRKQGFGGGEGSPRRRWNAPALPAAIGLLRGAAPAVPSHGAGLARLRAKGFLRVLLPSPATLLPPSLCCVGPKRALRHAQAHHNVQASKALTAEGLGASGARASGSSFDFASEMLARPSVISTTMQRPMSPPCAWWVGLAQEGWVCSEGAGGRLGCAAATSPVPNTERCSQAGARVCLCCTAHAPTWPACQSGPPARGRAPAVSRRRRAACPGGGAPWQWTC